MSFYKSISIYKLQKTENKHEVPYLPEIHRRIMRIRK